MLARSRPWLLLASWLLGLAGSLAGEPLRVLLPDPSPTMPSHALCLAEYLAERLAQCPGVQPVRGARLARVNDWLGRGVFDLSEPERWEQLTARVAVSAMVLVRAEPVPGAPAREAPPVLVHLWRAGGVTQLPLILAPGTPLPTAIRDLAQRLGRELQLGEDDLRVLGEVRISDPASFGLYYSTASAEASWPVNPHTGAVLSLAGLRGEPAHWAQDWVVLRSSAGYLRMAIGGRNNEKLKPAQSLVRGPLLRLLGTPQEAGIYPVLRLPRHAFSEPLMTQTEDLLLEIAKPLTQGLPLPAAAGTAAPAPGLDELGDDLDQSAPGLGGPPMGLAPGHGQASYSAVQRAGALRGLGVMASAKGLPLLRAAANSPSEEVRQAAAFGLGHYAGQDGLAELRELSGDASATVAFTAAHALWQRQAPPADFQARARAALALPPPYHGWAAMALAADATLTDPATLTRLASHPSSAVRARHEQTRQQALVGTVAALKQCLLTADSDLLVAAITRLPAADLVAGSEADTLLRRLANDPDNAVAQAARTALAPQRPANDPARAEFDLTVGVPFARQRAVARLLASQADWAGPLLRLAATQEDAHTRVAAWRGLLAREPAALRPLLLQALTEPHRLARLHAAALLVQVADASSVPAMLAAQQRLRDQATRLYLADAIARVTQRPPPPPVPPANRLTGDRTLVWQSGRAGAQANSPFSFYFKPSHGNHVRDDAIPEEIQEAHARGLVYGYNVGPMGEAGLGIVDGAAQDDYWLYLDDQLDTAALPFIDVIDFAHTGPHPDALWPAAWPYFCEDLGLDPRQVAGDKQKLSPRAAQAWQVWGYRLGIAGRNRVYDYFKLKFGRLHPGIQVAAAMGLGGELNAQDWQFDLSLVRPRPESSDAETYALIRRLKTLWPERPVFWLGQGLQLPDLALIKYDFKLPTAPLRGRHFPAYTEAVSAWLAGANPGWTAGMTLRLPTWAGDPDYTGYTLIPEDCTADSPKLRAALDFAFTGAEAHLQAREAVTKLKVKDPSLLTGGGDAQVDDLLESDAQDAGQADRQRRLARIKAEMFLSFQFIGRHVAELARVFASLPRYQAQPAALLLYDPALLEAKVAAPLALHELLPEYDCLRDFNALSLVELRRYRLIVVRDPAALTDRAITSLCAWLRDTPGVLLIQRDLTADNARLAPTPVAWDGPLQQDWPWEAAVTVQAVQAPPPPAPAARGKPVPPAPALTLHQAGGETVTLPASSLACQYRVTGDTAQIAWRAGEDAAVVWWRSPEFKGAVLFDGVTSQAPAYTQLIRQTLNDWQRQHGQGLALPATSGLLHASTPGWTAASPTTPTVTAPPLPGVDLLTGARQPTLGTKHGATLIGTDFQGRFAASYHGVTILCDQPITQVAAIDGGLRVTCPGLIRASTTSGPLRVTAPTGELPASISADRRQAWLYLETGEGLASEEYRDSPESPATPLTWIRCARPLELRTSPP